MGTRARLALLILAGIIGEYPPGPPPGNEGYSGDEGVCPTCKDKSTDKTGDYFFCADCENWFPAEAAAPEGK